jgi:hypothetical protein
MSGRKNSRTKNADGVEIAIALLVPNAIKADYSFGTQSFEYGFVTVTTEGTLQVRNTSSDYYSGRFGEFDDLRFRCQASGDMGDGKPYGYGIQYRGLHHVELRDAERMVKMLKKCSAVEKGFPVAPETFGQFVQLLCQGLKVTHVVKAGAGNGWHDETEYTTWKVSEIQWLVDRQIGDFMEKNKAGMLASRRA